MSKKVVEQPKDTVELVDITPDLAETWLRDYAYIGQRKPSQRHIDFLAYEMSSGRFKPSEFRIMHNCEKSYLTNGQHRLLAVKKSGVVIRGIIYHQQVNTAEEVADDYGDADSGRMRSVTDALAATGLQSQTTLPPTKFQYAAAASKIIIGGFAPRAYSSMMPEVRSRGIRKKAVAWWLPVAERVFPCIERGESEILRGIYRQAVLSVALVTMYYQPDKADEFWHGVSRNEGLRKGDARRTLAMFLMSNPARMHAQPKQSRYVAAAWNAFFEERQNAQLKVYDHSKPIEIAGTPYNGKSIITFTGENSNE